MGNAQHVAPKRSALVTTQRHPSPSLPSLATFTSSSPVKGAKKRQAKKSKGKDLFQKKENTTFAFKQ